MSLLQHREARDVIHAIRMGQVASLEDDDPGVIQGMEGFASWLNKNCDYLDAHFEQRDSRTEAVTYAQLRRFVAQQFSHGDATCSFTSEETICWMYVGGSSVLVPALHAFLGIRLLDCTPVYRSENKLQEIAESLQHWLMAMRAYMPDKHSSFLEELEKPGVSMRHYCLKRFGSKKMSVDALYNLEVAYNDALNALVRFMSRRMHLVMRHFARVENSFPSLQSDVEERMRKSRLQLMKLRQHADRCMDLDDGL